MKKISLKLKDGTRLDYVAQQGELLSFQVTTDGDFFVKEGLNVLFHRKAHEIKNCYLVTASGRFVAYERSW